MSGLINVGNQYKNQSIHGMRQVSQMEDQREAVKKNIDQAEDNQKMSAIGTGAGIGMMVGGPVGLAVGAGIGYLASELF